jgi:type III secretion protein Q
VSSPKSPLSTEQALADRLHHISEASARCSRLVFDQRFLAAANPATAALQLSSVQVAAYALPGALYLVSLGCDAGSVELLVHAPHQPAWAMAVATDSDARLRELAAVALLGPLVDGLRGCGLTGARANGIDSFVPTPTQPVTTRNPMTPMTPGNHGDHGKPGHVRPACALRLSDDRLITFTAQVLPPAVFQQLLPSLRRSRGSRRLRGSLLASGKLRLATRVLSLPLLQSLAVGDVLLLPCAAKPTDGWHARLGWGAASARQLWLSCRLAEQTITIEGEAVMSDDCDDNEHGTEGGLADPVLDSLGELDIPVRFELETVAVPLADLEAIQPGYVIELSTPLDAALLRLVAYGQIIGHAELVVVGDRLGARITRLVTRDERQPAH